MNERLLLSSTGMVHIDGCPTMRHVVDGKAPRTTLELTRTVECFPSPLALAENEYAEHYRVRQDEALTTDYVDVSITASELVHRTRKYTRCAVCSPDVPEFAPPVKTYPKQAGALTTADLDRTSIYGRLTAIHHTSTETRISTTDGLECAFGHAEQIEFYPRARPSEAAR